jgi:methyltransferase (TIGR00027 family)
MPVNSPAVKFGPGQPSRTSIVVAALRAFGAREPDGSVRNPDWLAERLITSEDLELIAQHPISRALRDNYQKGRQNMEVAGMSNLMLVRTRFVDEQFQRAMEEGADQVVILGAGFDTRAYRFADVLRDKPVFEVDYRSTQELKKRRLASALETVPSFVHFTEIDFKVDSLKDVLARAGYRADKKTFFIWEGVSFYLSENAVRATLGTIASYSAPGSTLVMDFAGRAMIEMLEKLPELSQHNYTTNWGEPWIFGVPDGKEREFFAECGLAVREIFSLFSRDAVQRYLTRSDGTKLGSIRGGRPSRRAFTTALRAIWMFSTRRSKWYALAVLSCVSTSESNRSSRRL